MHQRERFANRLLAKPSTSCDSMGCGHPGEKSAFNARSPERITGEGKRLRFFRVKERLITSGDWLAVAPAVQLPFQHLASQPRRRRFKRGAEPLLPSAIQS